LKGVFRTSDRGKWGVKSRVEKNRMVFVPLGGLKKGAGGGGLKKGFVPPYKKAGARFFLGPPKREFGPG